MNVASARVLLDPGGGEARTQVAVMADSTKIGRRLFAKVGELGRADWFVTDVPPPDDLAEALHGAGVEVVAGD